MRALGGSGPAGIGRHGAAGRDARWLRLLRPLLAVPPARLRATLRCAAWRGSRTRPMPIGTRCGRGCAAAARPRWRRRGNRRAGRRGRGLRSARAGPDRSVARVRWPSAPRCGLRVRRAVRTAGITPPALAALMQAIAGAPFPPPRRAVAPLAAAPRPATLAGVRLLPAGRLGPGLLAGARGGRHGAAGSGSAGAVWDGRFRLRAAARCPPDATLAPLGADAARLRAPRRCRPPCCGHCRRCGSARNAARRAASALS